MEASAKGEVSGGLRLRLAGPPIKPASTNGYATDDRIVRPGHRVSHSADPADPADERQEGW
jgi:hypothetical protein